MADKKSVFNDVPVTDKHYKIYKWCWKNKLMKTNSKGNFLPDKQIKRKDIAVFLYLLYTLIKKNWGLM